MLHSGSWVSRQGSQYSAKVQSPATQLRNNPLLDIQHDPPWPYAPSAAVEWLPGVQLGNTGFSWSDILLGALRWECWVRCALEWHWALGLPACNVNLPPGTACAAASWSCPRPSNACVFHSLPLPPLLLPGDLPNVYVYACNNPSESIIAKRRGYGAPHSSAARQQGAAVPVHHKQLVAGPPCACSQRGSLPRLAPSSHSPGAMPPTALPPGTIVSYNVPPYGRAGLYKQLAELKALIAGGPLCFDQVSQPAPAHGSASASVSVCMAGFWLSCRLVGTLCWSYHSAAPSILLPLHHPPAEYRDQPAGGGEALKGPILELLASAGLQVGRCRGHWLHGKATSLADCGPRLACLKGCALQQPGCDLLQHVHAALLRHALRRRTAPSTRMRPSRARWARRMPRELARRRLGSMRRACTSIYRCELLVGQWFGSSSPGAPAQCCAACMPGRRAP